MNDRRPRERKGFTRAFLKGALFAALLLVAGLQALGAIPNSQREALIAIYNATDGPHWSHSDNWLGPEGTEGTWWGVEIEPPGNTVIGLHLWGLGLQGTLPDVWDDLPDLQIVRLYDNALEGPLPAGLGRRWALYYLDFHNNKFTGGIPSEWQGMRSMRELYLSNNRLQGPLPTVFESWPGFWGMDITANSFWGPIPSSFCESVAPFGLQADGNALHAEDPELRARLTGSDWYWWARYQLSAPGAPSVVSMSVGTALLRWTPVDMGQWSGGYRIYTSDRKGGPYQLLAEIGPYNNSYQIPGLTPSSTTYFQVRSFRQLYGVPDFFVESEPGPELAVVTSGAQWVEAAVNPSVDILSTNFSFSAQAAIGLPPFRFTWEFGDGTTASGDTPTHTYAKAGTYTFTVTATDSLGSTATASGWVTPYRPLSIEVTTELATWPSGGTGAFAWNLSTQGGAPPFSYFLDFGDGSTSTSPPNAFNQVVHTYVSPGDYHWKATVTDSASHSVSAEGTVSYTLPLQLAASANATSGAVPLQVHFQAETIGGTPPVATEWDFGDGSPHQQGLAVDHTYTARWIYRWRMRVLDAAGAELTASGQIMAGMPNITAVTAKKGPPFTLLVKGDGFTSGCRVLINGQGVPKTTFKSATLLMAGGSDLLSRLPFGETVCLQVLDPSLGFPSQRFDFVRASLRRPDPVRPRPRTSAPATAAQGSENTGVAP
jgi:PKD repeat protein